MSTHKHWAIELIATKSLQNRGILLQKNIQASFDRGIIFRYTVEYCVDVNATVKRTHKLICLDFSSFFSRFTAWGQCRKESFQKVRKVNAMQGFFTLSTLLQFSPHSSTNCSNCSFNFSSIKIFPAILYLTFYIFFSFYLKFSHDFPYFSIFSWLLLTRCRKLQHVKIVIWARLLQNF